VKKFIALILFTTLSWGIAEARHIAGGEMSYEYLGINGSNLRYRITLKLYRDCLSSGAPLDDRAAITVYASGSSTPFISLGVNINRREVVQLTTPGPCIDNPPIVCYEIGYYIEEIELPSSQLGYTISYQRCCRIENISNVINSGNTGATYTATIPGTTVGSNAPENSSPTFFTSDTVVICENTGFIYSFAATDKDGDRLSYEFDQAYDGASSGQPQPQTASPPPYNSLPYAFPFNSFRPMGTGVTINSVSGLISGTAPAAGIYVITVAVVERRNGTVINRHRKDLHIKVAPCSIAAANLDPEYITCDGFNLTFQNKSASSLIKTYFWDFGVQGTNADTSNSDRPTFTFPDTGRYTIKLITNRNQDCSDTAYAVAKVYPGFFPKFSVLDGCKNVNLQFTDETTTKYGVVNYWKWSFGYPNVNPDTSRVQNPTYSYPNTGTYQAQLIVGSSFGCRDTIDNPVNVLDKPGIRLTNDTLICNIDTLQLSAQGNGAFTWSPNYMISNTNVSNPLVSPDQPTMYYVTLTSAPGCVNTDSVFVNVKQFVTINAGADTTICLTDSVRLNAVSDGLQFSWSPPLNISNPNARSPFALPTAATTTYTITANIGKCQSKDDIVVRTVPYPVAVASNDTSICFGDSAPLRATGGNDYRWSPSTGLSSNNIANPTASPGVTTRYIVAVFDNKGCPKPGIDSVIVRVVAPIPAFAGNDTAIVLGQPLQLIATGGASYRWTPTAGLNNPNVSNPIASLSSDFSYVVRVSSPEGCFALDTVSVKVFNTNPDIFVPTAFTPNNDKKNDVLRPIPVGISKLDYFRIYNRYGELVFSTTEIGKGWDGRHKGNSPGTTTYAWYVQGTDYTGKTIFKKGTSTLIR
jgi:gliding motility-associated-like protein